MSAHAVDAAIQRACPGLRARCTGLTDHVRVEVAACDVRELVEALDAIGVPDCGGIDSCVWAQGMGFYLPEPDPTFREVARLKLRRLRRWARVGAVS